MLEFLPEKIKDALSYVNLRFLYEIRLRANKGVRINYNGNYVWLGIYGITNHAEKALICDEQDVFDCIFKAGKYSVYSVEEQIKQGFLTGQFGERLGIAGEYVFDKGQPLALRNFSSVCIRVPHDIVDCGKEIYQQCLADGLKSILICSPPGLGKTTILRDLCRIISNKTHKNIFVCDERGEISAGNVGETCDVLKFVDKKTAFTAGIRAMRPEIIITDELSHNDIDAVEKAICSGVYVIASAHIASIKNVKPAFQEIFSKFVFLDSNIIGKISYIYDKEKVKEDG